MQYYLPDDTLKIIFSYCHPYDTIGHRLVNRQFNQIIETDNILWIEYGMKYLGPEFTNARLGLKAYNIFFNYIKEQYYQNSFFNGIIINKLIIDYKNSLIENFCQNYGTLDKDLIIELRTDSLPAVKEKLNRYENIVQHKVPVKVINTINYQKKNRCIGKICDCAEDCSECCTTCLCWVFCCPLMWILSSMPLG